MKYPYEEAAMRGEEMPDGLVLPQQLHFQALRLLYKNLHSGVIDRKTAVTEKKKMDHPLDVEMNRKKYEDIMYRFHSTLKKNIEGAANEYAKNRTPENADKMYEVIYGMKLTNLAEVENGTHS